MKNISNELTIIKSTKCVDEMLVNANIILPETYTTQELGVADNFYVNKTCDISVVIPAGTYDILSNSNNEILIDYDTIVFSTIETVQPEVIFNCSMQFSINFDITEFSDNILVSDRKLIINNNISTTSIFTIISNTHNTITLSSSESFTIAISGIIVQRSLTFEVFLNNFIALMNTANTRVFTKFECPTNNDLFVKYDEFTDIMIGYKSTYKDEGKINEVVGILNSYLAIDITNMSYEIELTPFYIESVAKLQLIYEHIDSWILYFARLKKLMSKVRIADAKVAEEPMQNLYNAKPIESRIIIDTLYNKYNIYGQEAYTEYKQELMFDIKID